MTDYGVAGRSLVVTGNGINATGYGASGGGGLNIAAKAARAGDNGATGGIVVYELS